MAPSRLTSRCTMAAICVIATLSAAPSGAVAQDEETFRVRVLGDSVPAAFGLKQSPLQNFRCSRKLPTNDCDNPAHSFSAIAASKLTADERDALPLEYKNHAIAGARPGQLVGNGQLEERVDWTVAADPDIVVVMIGANDLLSAKRCAVSKKCARKRLQEERTAGNIRKLLDRLLDDTSASIFVMRYYRLDGDLADIVSVINDAIDEATKGIRDELVVVKPPSFRLHGCAAPWFMRWVISFPQELCIHPNGRGQKKLAEPLLKAFQDEFAWEDENDLDFRPAVAAATRICPGVVFAPNTEYGTSRIRANNTTCRTARRVARRSRRTSVLDGPWRYRARGFRCRGHALETPLPMAAWRCTQGSAVVRFRRA